MTTRESSTYLPITDVNQIDIGKHALVEASAGTGKTYTIENLVVRLLEESSDLQLENILLVTFTEKATGELKQRIRQKIESTLIEDQEKDPHKRKKLQDTLNNFDGAAIHTIHGFCHALMKMFPFETGNLFEQELIDDGPLMEKLLHGQMRKDWPLQYGERLETLLALAGFPAGADDFVRKTVNMAVRFGGAHDHTMLRPDLAGKSIPELWQSVVDAMATLRSLAGKPPQLSDNYGRLNINKRSKNAIIRDVIAPIEQALKQFDDDGCRLTQLGPLVKRLKKRSSKAANIDRLVPSKWLKAGENLDECPNLEAIRELLEVLIQQVADLSHVLMLNAVPQLQRDAQTMKRRNGWMSYQDMLTRVADFVCAEDAGDSLAIIRQRYHIAFVDEFQDTDHVQWTIFRRLFLQSQRHGVNNRLFLIGDPKQAIYGFRGADVFTYLEARQRMQALAADGDANLYGLAVNWRSTPGLMAAYNRLFVQDTWFGKTNPSRPFEIGYTQTESPDPGRLPFAVTTDLSGRPALNIIDLSSASSHGVAKSRLAGFICLEIQRLIGKGEIRIGNGNGNDRPMHYGDIAVLVRSQSEFELLEPLLRDAAIPYAYYRKPGLFQCREAHWLSMVLHAVEQPDQPGAVRLAMLTPFFDILPENLLKWPEIPSTHASQRLLDHWHYLGRQQRWGVLFQSMMEDSGMILRHCRDVDWARTAANYRQLFEYLEVSAYNANLDISGLAALLEGLRRSEIDAGTSEDVHAIEDEGHKVQIMTMHMSKGLEFPVVFVGGGLTAPGNTDMHVYHVTDTACPDDGFTKVVDLRADLSNAQAEKECEDEDKRLYYVAFTRAKVKLYIPFYPDNGAQRWRGPICRFVSPSVDLAFDEDDVTQGLVARHMVNDSPQLDGSEIHWEADQTGIDIPCKELLPSQSDFRHRKIALASFTSIAHRITRMDADLHSQPAFYPDGAPGRDDDEQTVQPIIAPVQQDERDRLPGGSSMGSMFHHIFENVDFQAVENGPEDLLASDAIEPVIDAACSLFRIEPMWKPAIAQIVADTLRTTVETEHAAFALSALSPSQRRHEMEFFFPLETAPPDGVSIPGCTFASGACGELMVRGFIDLVFQWQDRFYFCDWKSNRIEAGYGKEAMQDTMASSGYILQYQLYTIAVMRWLKQQIGPRFNPDRHFGGVFYFFIRGMGRGGQSGILHIGPDALLPIEDLEHTIQKQMSAVQW